MGLAQALGRSAGLVADTTWLAEKFCVLQPKLLSMNSVNFEIPEGYDLSELVSEIKGFLGRVSHSEESFLRSYYDSFDWRLYAAGCCLNIVQDQNQVKLYLHNLEACGEAVSLTHSTVPRFAWDFPASFMRARLEPILEMRALIAKVELQCRRINLIQLNKDKKTVLRLHIEQDSLAVPGNDKSKSITRLCLIGIKGYEKFFTRASAFLRDKMGLPISQQSSLLLALSVLGRQPMDYSSKVRVRLDPQMRSDAATKQILRDLFQSMELNQPGLTDNLDSEFLHDYRVAVRRTRSALGQIKHVFPAETADKFSADFAWLASITGLPRDLDVYLLNFEAYKLALPVSIRGDLDPMRRFLEQKRKVAYEELTRFLKTSSYRSIMKRWRKFLDAPIPERSEASNAEIQVYQFASFSIKRLHEKVLREGASIDNASPAESLHDLRKTCKKLRYMLEFFQSLYAKKRVRDPIASLKRLQETLGDFQDYEVQEHSIKQFGQEMMKLPDTPAKTLLAMGVLAMELEKKRQQARIEFAVRFEDFASVKNTASFRHIFTVNQI